MGGSGHLITGADVATGTFVLMVFAAGAAMAVATVLAVFTIRRAGPSGLTGALWGGGLVLAGAVLAFLLFDRAPPRDFSADRRAIEARASELTARAIAPGSALACLDDISNVTVENSCEKALFATPEAVASAVAYIDARLSLLASSAVLVDQDPSYRSAFVRLRRAIEQDRFGFVAHVLAARGCNGPDCSDLALLRDTGRVLANLKAHAFESFVGAHSTGWPQGSGGVLAAAPAATAPQSMTMGVGPTMSASGPHPATTAPPGRFDYPSANSIPPVSIMSAEPETPPPGEAKTPPAKRQAPRKQTVREQAAPTQIAPQAAPPPQTSGSR
jgi:hypothetical protein